MKRLLFVLLCLLSTFLILPAQAVDYVRVAGTVVNNSGLPITGISIGFFTNENLDGPPITVVEVKNGTYNAVVPKASLLGIAFMISSTEFFAGWKTTKTFGSDTSLNFKIPSPFSISGRVVDAQGKSLGSIAARLDVFNDPFDGHSVSQDGIVWKGYAQRHNIDSDEQGFFKIYSYSTNQIGFQRQLGISSRANAFPYWVSADFLVSGDSNVLICIPINFGATLTLDKNCMEDKTAFALRMSKEKADAEVKAKADAEAKAKVAAELKAKQEAQAKAAAELKAKQEADAKAAAELKAKQDADAKAAADKVALNKAQNELAEARTALADSQKVNREQAARINSFEEQFKVLSESVATVQNQVSQLNTKLSSALKSLNTANAKIKKICAAKPKPKGC
jgi:hypothetical protein